MKQTPPNDSPPDTAPDSTPIYQSSPSAALRHRRQLFHILHKPSPENPAARYVNYLLAALILFNCAAVALETMPELFPRYRAEFIALEWASTAIFTVEYVFRVWVCVEQDKFSRPLLGRLRYILTPLPLLDLIVVASFVLPLDVRFLRIFRLSRLLRVLHMDNVDNSLQAVIHAISRRRTMLFVSICMMLICIYFAASAVYILEHTAQPDKFSSIPATLWWALTTLTTIGYGDMFPITPLGKICAGMISIIGIGIFALPTAIITAAILDGSKAAHQHMAQHCPHCGKHIHPLD